MTTPTGPAKHRTIARPAGRKRDDRNTRSKSPPSFDYRERRGERSSRDKRDTTRAEDPRPPLYSPQSRHFTQNSSSYNQLRDFITDMERKDAETARQARVLDEKDRKFARYAKETGAKLKEKDNMIGEEGARHDQVTSKLRKDVEHLKNTTKMQGEDRDKLMQEIGNLQTENKVLRNERIVTEKEYQSLQEKLDHSEAQVEELKTTASNYATQIHSLINANQELARHVATVGVNTYNFYSQYSQTLTNSTMQVSIIPLPSESAKEIAGPSAMKGERDNTPVIKVHGEAENSQDAEKMEE